MLPVYNMGIIDFFFPLDCAYCGRQDNLARLAGICRKCYVPPQPETEKLCKICKSPLSGNDCPYCNSRNVFFSGLYFVRYRDDFEKELIRRIKFKKSPHHALLFRFGLGKITEQLRNLNLNSIVPVPSHEKTWKNRPYFTSAPVLKQLSAKLKLDIITPVVKKSQELQADKTYFDRFVHAARAFNIKENFKDKLNGNILLVDDVFTTGASVNEIGKILLANGAESVYILILARNRG